MQKGKEHEAIINGSIPPYNPIEVGYKDGKGFEYHDRALLRASKTSCKRILHKKLKVKPSAEFSDNAIFVKGFSPVTAE